MGDEVVFFSGKNCYGLLLRDVLEGVERETLKNCPFVLVLVRSPLYVSQVLFMAVDFPGDL